MSTRKPAFFGEESSTESDAENSRSGHKSVAATNQVGENNEKIRAGRQLAFFGEDSSSSSIDEGHLMALSPIAGQLLSKSSDEKPASSNANTVKPLPVRKRAFFGEESSTSTDQDLPGPSGSVSVLNNPKFHSRKRAFMGEDSTSTDEDTPTVSSVPTKIIVNFNHTNNPKSNRFVGRRRAFFEDESSSANEDNTVLPATFISNNDHRANKRFVGRKPAFFGEESSSSREEEIVQSLPLFTTDSVDNDNSNSNSNSNSNHSSNSFQAAAEARQELNKMLLKGARKDAL